MFYIDGSSSGKGSIIGLSLTTTLYTNYKFAQQVELATLIDLLSHVLEPGNLVSDTVSLLTYFQEFSLLL